MGEAKQQQKNLVSKQAIAKIFGVSTRRIEQLKEEGVINGEGRPTKYDLLPTIMSYIKYLSDKANGREKKEADGKNESARLEADTKIKVTKAEIAELQLKELKGEMHRAKDVEEIMTDHVLMIRSLLMGMPNKLAVDVARINSPAEAAECIKKEVYYILNELSQYEYDPEAFKERVRERTKWQNGENAENE